MTLPQVGVDEASAHLWAYTDLGKAKDGRVEEYALGLASVSFLGAALRRRARVWLVTALAGMFAGLGVYVYAPPPYQASTSLLLTQASNVDPLSAVQTDLALGQARAVAGGALHQLRLTESVAKFQKSYIVTAPTDRIVTITASAPSAAQAVRRATALASAFLSFRTVEVRGQQALDIQALNQKIVQDEQQTAVLAGRVAKVQAEPASAERLARLHELHANQKANAKAIVGLKQEITNYPVATASLLAGSGVLDPAVATPRSRFRQPAIYAAAGLIAGLVLGLAIVLVGELMTDRLRRRDDVAKALGAPVLLSTGKVRARPRLGRRRFGRRHLAAARGGGLALVIRYMRKAMPEYRGAAAALAVVAIDDLGVAASAVTALAVSLARDGSRVLLADLSATGAVGRLLGVTAPGVRIATADGQQLIICNPEPGDSVPAGPVRPAPSAVRRRPAEQPALDVAYDNADVLLSLARLDPALGAEHLASWAAATIVVINAGQSSAAKIHATGEIIRLAGIPLAGAILLGTDEKDETIGTVHQPSRYRQGARQQAQVGAGVTTR